MKKNSFKIFKKKSNQGNGGITLIALIITMIVLLILAGVSIATLTGENGLLTKANQAKVENDKAGEKDLIQLAYQAAKMEEYQNTDTSKTFEDFLKTELEANGLTGVTVIDNGDGTYSVILANKSSYLIEENGNTIDYIVKVAEPTPEDSELATLATMSNGVIEIEFLSKTSYNVTTTPNEPILRDEMKAVYWVDTNGNINTSSPQSNTVEVKQTSSNYKASNWYQYNAQTGSNDGKTSRWANATTSDGSYYVWIPRYAYRIIYFDTPEHENSYRAGTLTEEAALANNYIVGYSDARGIVDKNGKRPTSVTSTTSISVNDKYFRVHPVFDGNTEEGGWNSKLEGIWVMKYEASRNDATKNSIGSGTTPKSLPNVKSWVSTNTSTMFTYARDAYNSGNTLNTVLNSHMMKNSEWGAVAYLAESKYGRNGTEISVNQCENYITGAGRGTGDNQIYNSTYVVNTDTKLPEADQQYSGTIGQLSSTTGNIYGIYDISGGSWEYVMGFYGTDNNTPTLGSSGFTTATFPSERKYYQIYNKTSSDGNDLGDALYETKGWNSDDANFVNSNSPVFGRGGNYNNTSNAGAFSFYYGNGYSRSYLSFRVCLAVK